MSAQDDCLANVAAATTEEGTNQYTLEAIQCVANGLKSEITTSFDYRMNDLAMGLDLFFLLFASIVMFMMQAGFTMLCCGCVRKKNVQNTILKNLLDACGCAIGYFAFGYAFAYGGEMFNVETIMNETTTTPPPTIVGTQNFFLMDFDNYAFWMYQYAFAATSCTIVAGTLAERSQLIAYLTYSFVLSGFVFPVIAHSVWSMEGFLNATRATRLYDCGMIDVAGSAVVHVTGGLAALIASLVVGPRCDRFYDDHGKPLLVPKPIRGHSISLQVLGTLLLWFGWYGFNIGAVHFISQSTHAKLAALSAVTTTLSAASGTITALIVSAYRAQRETGEITFDLKYALNGCLSGLVGITGGCCIVQPWAAIIIGCVSGLIYIFASSALIQFKIDDAVDAIPVHLCNGIWGVVAVGLFAHPTHLKTLYSQTKHVGWFYSWGNNSSDATLLGTNLLGILFIIGFVSTVMIPFFCFLSYMGWLRADQLEEIVGLDMRFYGGIIGRDSLHSLHYDIKKERGDEEEEGDLESSIKHEKVTTLRDRMKDIYHTPDDDLELSS